MVYGIGVEERRGEKYRFDIGYSVFHRPRWTQVNLLSLSNGLTVIYFLVTKQAYNNRVYREDMTVECKYVKK